MNKFEQPPEIRPEEKEEIKKTAFETREGEKFFAERLVSPDDPRVERVQEMLENQLGKEEVDPVEVMKEAMTGKMATGEDVPPYLVHVAENSKGEVNALHTSAVVETVNSKGKESKKSAVWLGCYAATSPEARGKGLWKNLFKAQEQAANADAKRRGLEIKGFMAELHNEFEPILNKEGIKRAYVKTKEGYKELPYEQPPVDWDTKTGKPAEDAGTVSEHLMLKLSSGKEKLSGKELMEMVRGMYLYNNYREEEYFKNEKAYQKHTGFVKGIEQKLDDFIGGKKVHLLSGQERESMKAMGIKFFEHRKKEDREEAGKLVRLEKAQQKKEWREHFGALAEAQLEKEKMARVAKRKELIEKKSSEDKEEEIRRTAYEIYKKREAGQEPGYTWKEIDEMLRKENLIPRTEEARKFLEKWDWFQAQNYIDKNLKKRNEF